MAVTCPFELQINSKERPPNCRLAHPMRSELSTLLKTGGGGTANKH
uniref:Uncharacterized protein n=1 Tax=Anguilla anguilla TaxID=7936 RepID=A0A0E9S6R1_ANGAN